MSDKTATFWRRLDWRLWRQHYLTDTPEAERLAWIYPCTGPSSTRPRSVDETRMAAHVRDISLGGVVLLANRGFESGLLLKVELQGPEDQEARELIVRILHVSPRKGGYYLLSCCYAKELSDEDLEVYGARRLRPEEQQDGRAWIRYPCQSETAVRSVVAAEQQRIRATIENISAGGVGLVSDRPFESGMLISLTLQAGGGQQPRTIRARVVHSKKRGENEWLIGCTFVGELTEDDIVSLMP